MTEKNGAGRLLTCLGLAVAAAGLALCVKYDMAVNQALYNPTALWARFFRVWGWALAFVPALALMGFDIRKRGRAALPAVTATVVNGLLFVAIELSVVNTMKLLWGRMRFDDMVAAGDFSGFSQWFMPQGLTGGSSFPSGHTAFTCIVFLLLCYALRRGRGKVPAFLFSSAYLLAMMASRIVMGRHFPSDVIAAAVIGGLCMAAAWRLTPGLAAVVQRRLDRALRAGDARREEKNKAA